MAKHFSKDASGRREAAKQQDVDTRGPAGAAAVISVVRSCVCVTCGVT